MVDAADVAREAIQVIMDQDGLRDDELVMLVSTAVVAVEVMGDMVVMVVMVVMVAVDAVQVAISAYANEELVFVAKDLVRIIANIVAATLTRILANTLTNHLALVLKSIHTKSIQRNIQRKTPENTLDMAEDAVAVATGATEEAMAVVAVEAVATV